MALICELVGGVSSLVDGVAGLLGSGSLEHILELDIGNGSASGVEVVEERHLLVGIVNIDERVDKPSVAQGIGVELSVVVADDEILGVEHIEHLHVVLGQLAFNEVVVAGELSSVVTAHCLVEVRWHRLAEVLYIEHAVVDVLVGKNLSVDGTLNDTSRCCILCGNKCILVDVTLVYCVHINQHDCSNDECSNLSVGLALEEEHHSAQTKQQDEEAAHCVAAYHRAAHSLDGLVERGELLHLTCCYQLLVLLSRVQTAKDARSKPTQDANERTQAK